MVNRLGFLNLLSLVLTIHVLIVLLIDTFFKLPPETSEILGYFDNLICTFFFIEFIYNFSKAKDKIEFMKLGWIDLLSCIPMIDSLRAARVIRLIILIRIIRAFKTIKGLMDGVFENKVKGTLSSMVVLAILLIIFSSIGILAIETDPNSNIKTAEDAIWWTYTTITTVGYGDKFPITTEGRILAMVLMTFGVGLFGTFTAYLSSLFVKEKN